MQGKSGLFRCFSGALAWVTEVSTNVMDKVADTIKTIGVNGQISLVKQYAGR